MMKKFKNVAIHGLNEKKMEIQLTINAVNFELDLQKISAKEKAILEND